MVNEDILKLSESNQQQAWEVIKESDILGIWQSIGAEVNLIGSLKSGLLMKNLDIDFHIYSDPVTVGCSFAAMSQLAENHAIERIEYINLLSTHEACIEWHAWYRDSKNNLWKMDMIHIQRGSAFDGYMERVTEAVIAALTPEIKRAILQIKYDIPETEKITGLEVYRAVLEGEVRNYSDFAKWHKDNLSTGVTEWIPA